MGSGWVRRVGSGWVGGVPAVGVDLDQLLVDTPTFLCLFLELLCKIKLLALSLCRRGGTYRHLGRTNLHKLISIVSY